MSDVIAAQVTVSHTAATKLVSAIPNGQQAVIFNRDAAISVFVGPANVTATGGDLPGYEVKAGETLVQGALELPAEIELYAIAASGSPRVDVLQLVGD